MAMKMLTRWRGGVAAILLGASLLALLTTENSLPADAEAKAAALPADLAKIPSDGALVVSGRVADLWGGDLLTAAREKWTKAMNERPIKEFQDHFGLSLEQVERMTFLMLAPPPQRSEPLLFVRTVKPYDLAKVIAAVKNVKAKKYKDEMLFVSDKDWTIYPLDDRSLVYSKQREINALIDHPQQKTEGNLAAALRLAAGKHSLVAGINIKRFYESLSDRLPGEAEPFLPLLQAHSATLRVDVTAGSRAAAVLTFAADKNAKDAIKPAEAGIVLLRAGLAGVLAKARKEGEKGELDQELKDGLHVFKQFQESLKAMRIEQKGAALHASFELKVDAKMAGRTLWDAARKMRQAAARAQSMQNLKHLGLAMVNYADTMRGQMPAQATYDKNGKPMLSWRVLILPYLDEQKLYNQFHLNEPWDSEHNKKLLAKMPKVYAHAQDIKSVKEHRTYYQGFFGKGAFFEGKQGIRYPAEINDGTSNTIMIVEASKAVPWTKPEDVPYDPAKPLPKLGLPNSSIFLAGMCDGSVRSIVHGISEQSLRSGITRNEGDIPGSDW